MQKIYVLDTNVLLCDPASILSFADRDVVIPMTVIEELDKKKNETGELGYHARKVFRVLSDIRKKGSLWKGVEMEQGGKVSVKYLSVQDILAHASDFGPCVSDLSKNDNLILCTAIQVKLENPLAEVALVTNDVGMQVVADMIPLKTEYYRKNRLKDKDLVYTGRTKIWLKSEEKLWESTILDNGAPVEKLFSLAQEEVALEENQFLELISPSGEVTLARYFEGRIYPLYQADKKPFGVNYRNCGQAFVMESLLMDAESAPFVFVKSPAGTGKTFLALACALEQTVDLNVYRNILYTRCNVRFDSEELGALPGTELEKMSPLVRPAMDNLEHLAELRFHRSFLTDNDVPERISEYGQYLIDKDILRIESMSFMRGRSLDNVFLVQESCSVCKKKGASKVYPAIEFKPQLNLKAKTLPAGKEVKILIRDESGSVLSCSKKLSDMDKAYYGKVIKWSSSNPDVATVDSEGNVTAVSPGTAKISVKYYTKTLSCIITVR